MASNNYLKIDVNIRDHFKSNDTAIVFGRLMYWFSKKPEGFYKFKQSCKKHPLYKKGDSWGEELGMSRKVLDPILSRLVNHHLTKSAYLKSTDRFAGKIFCSYTNHKTNQTHYSVDKEALDSFLASISVKMAKPKEVDSSSKASKNKPSPLPCDVPKQQPLVRARQTAFNTQTTTSLSGDVLQEPVGKLEEEKRISKEMVGIWNSHTEDSVVWMPSTAKKLCNALHEFFKGCLENFKNYCATIASSNFLTGKSPSKFKAFLFWSIKPEVIQSILNGAYGVKSFFSMLDPQEKALRDDIRHLDNQIKIVEMGISRSAEQTKSEQKKLIDDLKETLSLQEMELLKEQSDQEFYDISPLSSSDVPSIVASFANMHFHGFLQRKLKERLGLVDEFVTPLELIAKKQTLVNAREKKSSELNELHFNKKKMRNLVFASKELLSI
jgi:hypothetical protein